jgi:anaerobic selenocysteine-containing dehydrogenase
MLAMSNAVVEPYGEARGEWPALADLCTKLAERAAARGLESYPRGDGSLQRYDDLWDRFTLKGAFATEEGVVRECLADAVTTGNMPPGTTVETFREQGCVRYDGWPKMALGRANASPFPHRETHSPLRNHVERGHPYPTLTRRAQFLIDHPWYREAGEDLPTHKEAPAMGGNHPFRLSGGHARWSIHAMNATNTLMLETHRGRPFVLINDAVARDREIEDDALVRVRNDVGEFVIPARTSPCQRPDGLTIYNGFEGFQFVGGAGSNEVEPGMVKWLHLVEVAAPRRRLRAPLVRADRVAARSLRSLHLRRRGARLGPSGPIRSSPSPSVVAGWRAAHHHVVWVTPQAPSRP